MWRQLAIFSSNFQEMFVLLSYDLCLSLKLFGFFLDEIFHFLDFGSYMGGDRGCPIPGIPGKFSGNWLDSRISRKKMCDSRRSCVAERTSLIHDKEHRSIVWDNKTVSIIRIEVELLLAVVMCLLMDHSKNVFVESVCNRLAVPSIWSIFQR